MTQRTAPYGTWESPITPEAIVEGSISFDAVLVDPVTSTIYHVEKRPSEQGRSVIVETKTNTDVFGAQWDAKSMVHDYGGGAQVVYNGVIYFSNNIDGRVYQLKIGEQPTAVTPESIIHESSPVDRYGDFSVHPLRHNLVFAIYEHHQYPDDTPASVSNFLCVIDAESHTVSKVVSGADFYFSPRISPDGTHIAYQSWNHPDMPWEGSEMYIAALNIPEDIQSASDVTIGTPIHVAGQMDKISAVYPTWKSNDTLIFTSDQSGYQNPWTWDKSSNNAIPLLANPLSEDFGTPQWTLAHSPFTFLNDKGLFAAYRGGRTVLYLINLSSNSSPIELDCPFVDVQDIGYVGGRKTGFVFIGQRSDDNHAVVFCTLSSSGPPTPEYQILKTASSHNSWPTYLSPPIPKTVYPLPEQEPVHVVYYAPKNPGYSGSSIAGEKPPCVVGVHGGPTSMESQKLNWTKQLFTSRGFAWLDVNYGGSSGYGRAYIERLQGQWGIVDVHDTIFAAKDLGEQGLIDPARTVIRGGSSGGYTVLACVANAPAPDNKYFTAGASYYGISDLLQLEKFTHKFESHYMEKLLGGTSQQMPNVYHDRSPVNNADRIKSALLVLQGSRDTVVPPEQSETIVKAIQKNHGYVEYKLYEGEGHGFRKADNIIDSVQSELDFYVKVLKIGT